MIFEAILSVVFTFVRFIIGLIPANNPIARNSLNFDLSGITYFLDIFFMFFPRGLFMWVVGNIILGAGSRIIIAIVGFIVEKIPTVNW